MSEDDPCNMPDCDNLVKRGIRLDDGYELWVCNSCMQQTKDSGLISKILVYGLLLWSVVSIGLLTSGVLGF